MNRMCLVFLAVGTFVQDTAFADDLVRFPTGNAAWTVDITYRNSSAASPSPEKDAIPAQKPLHPVAPKATRIEVVQVNNIKRVRITWNNGKTSDRWTVPSLPVTFEENPGASGITPVEERSLGEKFRKLDLPFDLSAFTWLKPEFLQEKSVHYHGKSCFHFVGFIILPKILDNGPEIAPVKVQAWIDSETLLPVARQTETSLCIFTFQEQPPGEPLVLPPKFKKKIDYYKMVMGVQ